MDGSFQTTTAPVAFDLRPAVQRILDIQATDGAIAWFENGPWDPWNHTESAMALCAAGEFAAAVKAYEYLASAQRPDGAWFGDYGNALPMVERDYISRETAPAFLDSNFCAYPAVGIAHYFKTTGDLARTRVWWPMVKRALDFVLTLQRTDGTICWSFEALGTDEEDALLAGNASILKSLECGLFLAGLMQDPQARWQTASHQLRHALQTTPELFDRRKTGTRFAMDWYYPVLAGALDLPTAQARIFERWETFVTDDPACCCVSDEPWITVAETAELVLALLAIDEQERAADLFAQMLTYRDEDGAFWMGWQSAEQIFWPRERPSWTQAAVILAADALDGKDPGSRVLIRSLL
ncbi:MAG: prenyltransferase [Pseudomonadota bacterium]